MLQIRFRTVLVVAGIIRIYAKTKDRDYIYDDINLDNNRRFEKIDGFKDFIQKFDTVDVFDKIHSMLKTKARNISVSDEVDLILQGIDPTDDLLRLKVQNGNPKVLALSSRRQYIIKETFKPPTGLSVYPKDRFNYKPRLYELMKQAIYQARNKMVIMQMLREKHNKRLLYKMGFLIGKTDTLCKVFNKLTFHGYRTCHRVLNIHRKWSKEFFRFRVYELQVVHMRALHLWFQAELLTDLVIRNDVAYHNAYAQMKSWNFTE